MEEKKPQSVRCQAQYHLDHNASGGNMVLILEGNSIYVRCGRGTCKRWTKLSIDVPGIDFDFSKVAFTQETLPKNFKVGNSQPPVPPKRITVAIKGD